MRHKMRTLFVLCAYDGKKGMLSQHFVRMSYLLCGAPLPTPLKCPPGIEADSKSGGSISASPLG